MPFLEEYDALDPALPLAKMALFGQCVRATPDALFAEVREHRPIMVMPAATLVTRFSDVQEVLLRPTVFSVRGYVPMMDPSVGPFMLARDATEINRRDKSIMLAMLSLDDLPRIRTMVESLADAAIAASGGTIEVVSQLSRAVPVALTGSYFGFPGPDAATMMRWSRATQYDMFHNTPQNDPKVHADNLQAGAEMKAYFADFLPKQRAKVLADPQPDDTFSRLLRTVLPAALGFDDERIVINTIGLLIGGVETTSAAIVQALDQILTRPDQLAGAQAAAAAGNDVLLAQYVWEALRFHPVNPFVVRFCEADYTIADDTDRKALVKAGTVVLAATASAMMDDNEIDDPEEFRLDRSEYDYFHFGFGQHLCLGDQVSKVQVPAIVKKLLLRKNLRRAAGTDGTIDFADGPFPERYVLQFDP